MNLGIHYLRGLAAIVVLIGHTAHLVQRAMPSVAYGDITQSFGLIGVMMFFCISGYLMAASSRSATPSVFLWNRFLRIYPTYFVAVLLGLAIVFFVHNALFSSSLWSLTLLPLGPVYGPLQVEWTLNYEIFFYLVIAIFCLERLRKFLLYFLIIWAMIILINIMMFGSIGGGQFPATHLIFFSYYNLGFIFGGLVYFMSTNTKFVMISKRSFPIFLISAIILLFGGKNINNYVYMIVGPLVLAGLLSSVAAMQVNKSFLPAIKLGDYSYAIYLIHQTVLGATYGLVYKHITSPMMLLISLVGAALVVGALLGEVDSRMYPTLKRLRESFTSRRPAVPKTSPV